MPPMRLDSQQYGLAEESGSDLVWCVRYLDWPHQERWPRCGDPCGSAYVSNSCEPRPSHVCHGGVRSSDVRDETLNGKAFCDAFFPFFYPTNTTIPDGEMF